MSRIFNTDISTFHDANKKQDVFFKRMPEEQYEYKEHYLVIDSRDRDRTKYPNPREYTIQFNNGDNGNVQEQFKNIVSVQLIDATVPDAVTGLEPYLTLDIPELRPSYAGTNDHLSNTFAILEPETKGTPFARCKFVSPALNKYRTPISSLNKLTIQFKDYKGTPYVFGTDATPPTVPTVGLQNMLVFKIVTRESDYKMLEPILT